MVLLCLDLQAGSLKEMTILKKTPRQELLAAIARVDASKVEELVRQNPSLVRSYSYKKKRAPLGVLIELVGKDTLPTEQYNVLASMLEVLLKYGADPNALIDGSPAIMWLAVYERKGLPVFPLAKVLMSHGMFDPSTKDAFGNTPSALLEECKLLEIFKDRAAIEGLLALKEQQLQYCRAV